MKIKIKSVSIILSFLIITSNLFLSAQLKDFAKENAVNIKGYVQTMHTYQFGEPVADGIKMYEAKFEGGNLTEYKLYEDDGDYLGKFEYEYDASGNLTREIEFDYDDEIELIKNYRFDLENNLIEESEHEANESIINKIVY